MNNILRFFNQYDILFYLLLGGVFLVYAQRTFIAWREWSLAQFGLEKENSQRKFNQGLTVLVFTGLIGLGLFVINTFVTPSVPGVNQLPTPEVNLTLQPTAEPIPTLAATMKGIIPTITSYLTRGCVPGQVDWTDPINGGAITGKVELKGTVSIQNLGFYKYEFTPVANLSWETIAGGNTEVINGPLGGAWDTSRYDPGEYKLRLVVYDNQNNPLPDCTIQITIKASEQ